MTFSALYAVADAPKSWAVPQDFEAYFNWEFGPERERLLALYERGKAMQWNANERIDWNQDLDPENQQQLPPEALPILDAPVYRRLSPREQMEVRRHHQAWSTSQFLQGEQGALICAAKTVQQCPTSTRNSTPRHR